MINAMNHVAVGDIFVSSWGYEQTNVDFYEVTRKTKAMIELTPIAAQQVDQTGWASDTVKPAPGKFVGAPMMKRPKAYEIGKSVQVYARIASYASASKIEDPKNYSTHRSWYA